jgi:hypothetical protein
VRREDQGGYKLSATANPWIRMHFVPAKFFGSHFGQILPAEGFLRRSQCAGYCTRAQPPVYGGHDS